MEATNGGGQMEGAPMSESGNSGPVMTPVVDFQPFHAGGKQKLGEEMVGHLGTSGYLYMVNHGITAELIQKVFQLAKEFFALPVETKNSYLRPLSVDEDTGYVPIGHEKLVNIGTEEAEGGKLELRENFNFYPFGKKVKEIPDFHENSNKFFEQCKKICEDIMECLALGLDLEKSQRDVFRQGHRLVGERGNTSMLRFLQYPPIQEIDREKANITWCGTHSDYGTITLLFQDANGGLEVENSAGDFVRVPVLRAPDGTLAILVQAADLLERQTSGRLISAKHRVPLPTGENLNKTRQSIAFFLHPDDDCVATCLDGSDKYPPVKVGEFIKDLFATTYLR